MTGRSEVWTTKYQPGGRIAYASRILKTVGYFCQFTPRWSTRRAAGAKDTDLLQEIAAPCGRLELSAPFSQLLMYAGINLIGELVQKTKRRF
jgi:DNA-directed RNA polymerase alpha subunit